MLYGFLMVCWVAAGGCSTVYSAHGFEDRGDCQEWIGLTIDRLHGPFRVQIATCGPRSDV